MLLRYCAATMLLRYYEAMLLRYYATTQGENKQLEQYYTANCSRPQNLNGLRLGLFFFSAACFTPATQGDNY